MLIFFPDLWSEVKYLISTHNVEITKYKTDCYWIIYLIWKMFVWCLCIFIKTTNLPFLHTCSMLFESYTSRIRSFIDFFYFFLFWHSSSHLSLSVRASAQEWMSHKIILQYSSMRRATHPKSLTGLQKCCSEWNKHAAKSEGGRPVFIYSLPFSGASSLHTFIQERWLIHSLQYYI